MLWILPLACAAVGLLVLMRSASIVRREIPPTTHAIDALSRDLRAALVRVQADTDRTRRRYNG